MPTRRRADSTPDLFASLPAAEAPARPSAPPATRQSELGHPAWLPRHLLPRDLAGALARLGDAEVDALLVAVTAEAERRGRPAPSRPRAGATARSRPRRAAAADDGGAASLTTGKLNAVRAALRAGVRPAAIARQFGLSQSEVRRALAAEKLDR